MDFTRSSLTLFVGNVVRTMIRFLGIAVFARLLGALVLGAALYSLAVLGHGDLGRKLLGEFRSLARSVNR
ncbi:hypothetical protein [Halorhabdus rudnickae]|uniref:hypothetical protein n=1 Tax=Halorhabdus rudnickae TaxID=1775544 RepID=UPI00108451DE|nr:hypothetical protein [Halorhabdus rudnickae]